MLCYAWDRLGERELIPVGTEDAPRMEGLVAQVLAASVERLVTRGLDRGYRGAEVTTSEPRGRIEIGRSIGRATLARGRLVCTVTNRTPDVLHNRILRATLERLATVHELDGEMVERLRRLVGEMRGVSSIVVREADLAAVQLHANIADYRFPLELCALVHRCMMPDPSRPHRMVFRDFTRDAGQMGQLFEAFVRRFWELRLTDWTVRKTDTSVAWSVAASPEVSALVPGLETDVLLQSDVRSLVVETKFVSSPTVWHFGREKLQSAHLRQLFAYLEVHDPGGARGVEGILLYATVGRSLDLRMRLQGHPMWVRSLDLARPWEEVERDLARVPLEAASV